MYNTYLGRVYIDIKNGVSGTEYPIGTQHKPVNNYEEALMIAKERGIIIDVVTFFVQNKEKK